MIAFYLRSSMLEGDSADSIESQRRLLEKYLEDNRELEGDVLEYVDEGYSEENLNRPGFARMLGDCRKGLVSVILVKDLSRIGNREAGAKDYVEELFPWMGIRVIAADCRYDSSLYIEKKAAFLMGDHTPADSFYRKELSKRRKNANEEKWSRGLSTAGFAPFGYRKDSSRKGKWQRDPEAAKIVRLIFQKAAEGWDTSGIASFLNEEKIPTPFQYNKKNQMWKNLNTGKAVPCEQLWNSGKVRSILNRYEYTGAIVAGRAAPVLAGSRYVRKKEESKWVITEGANEGIVSREEYELAHRALRKRTKPDYITSRNYLLKGKVRCGNCHLMLSYGDASADQVYYCGHGKSTGKYSKCCKEYFLAEKLDAFVFEALKTLFRRLSSIYSDIGKGSGDRNDAWQLCGGKQWELFHQAEIFLREAELSREMVEAFIDTVYVYHEKQIRIVYCHEEEIRAILQGDF